MPSLETEYDWLALKLSPPSPSRTLPPPAEVSPPPSPQHPSPLQFIQLPPPPPYPLPPSHQEPYLFIPSSQEHKILPKRKFPSQESSPESEARASKKARKTRGTRNNVKSETVPAPFPWATSKRAVVHSLGHLRSHGITTITGAVICKRCGEQTDIAFDLEEKFNSVAHFIEQNKFDLHDRAPASWNRPVLPTCERCGTENSLRPVITKKRSINWLFLLLGQWIGCCNLKHLKYFCKHAMNHRTGAKDRLLYAVYLCLCKQLQPKEPFVLFDE